MVRSFVGFGCTLAGAVRRDGAGRPREQRCQCDRARSSDGTLPPSASEGEGNVKSSDARDSVSRGDEKCALLGCGAEASVLVEHPQRGLLLVCPHHAQRMVRVGGEVRKRYRTLPYASAVVQTPTDREYRASRGGGCS